MNSEWQRVALDELYEFSSGLSKPRSAFGSGYPFLSFKDVFYNSAVPKQLTELVNSTSQERERCSIARGDVFLTRTSETMDELGMSCVALADIADATFNGFTKRLRPKHSLRVVPEFARYYFRSPEFRSGVTAMTSMSTRASLNNEMLSRLYMVLPSHAEQGRIGQALGALDDRIFLLRETNKTLESIAQAIFKSWFVDFDPVRAKMEGRQPEGMDEETAALFPDRFEELPLGTAPRGWQIRGLDNIADYLNGLALQKFPPTGQNDLPIIKIAQLRKGETDKNSLAAGSIKPAYVIQDGDILFSWSGSLEVEIWCGGCGALNQHLFKVTSAKYPKWFYYLWTKHHLPSFRHIAESKATTMGHIQRKHLSDAMAIVPCFRVLEQANEIFEPLINQQIENAIQARTLTALRDALLPRLISGQLRLPDTQEQVENALS